MAWTDETNTLPADYGINRSLVSRDKGMFDLSDPPLGVADGVIEGDINAVSIYSIYRISDIAGPGFDDGYRPCSTPDIIANNFNEGCDGSGDGGGGGSGRPTVGMIYPRREC